MKVSIKQYSQTLFKLTDGKSEQEVLDIVAKFAEALKKDGQLKNVGEIIKKFGDIYNTKNGIVEAAVISVRKLDESQLVEISSFVKERYVAKEVVINNVVDEKIKGGLIVRVGDEILDASIQTQLNKLKDKLIS